MTPDQLRSQPYDDDAERTVLSCLLQYPPLIPEAKISVPAELFYHPANRLFFTSILTAYDLIPIDLVSLSIHFERLGISDKVGGNATIAQIFNFCPSPPLYPYYLGVLRELWRARETINLAVRIQQSVYEAMAVVDEKDPMEAAQKKAIADLIELHQRGLGDKAGRPGVTLRQAQTKWMDRYVAGTTQGRPFKHPWLNRILGGHAPGNAIVIAGPRGGGKSALAFEDAIHMAEQGARTSYFSLEQTATQMFQRHCCMRGVNSNAFLTNEFTLEELHIVTDTRSHALDIPLVIHESVTDYERMVAMIQMEKHQDGLEYAVIDGPARVRGFRAANREQELSGIVWGFKELAKRLEITVAMLAHLNQDGVTRGSEDIENHIDQLLLVIPSKEKRTLLDPPGHKTLFRVNKNRDGKDRVGCIYRLRGEHYTFEEDTETEIEAQTRKDTKQ